MKLYSLAITAAFLCIIFVSLRDAVYFTGRLDQRVEEEFLSYSAKKFIAQSFKNTCREKGFASLDEWKKSCKSLFSLESISYEISYDSEEKSLLCAKWVGAGILEKASAQVFYRLDKNKSGGFYE